MDIKADEAILGEDGYPDMLKLDPFLYSSEQANYYGVDGYIGDAYAMGKRFL
jgi:hypothetical protein